MRMRSSVAVLAATMLASVVPMGLALADGPRFEIAPFAGYRMGGQFDVVDNATGATHSVDLGDDASFGVDLGLYRDQSSFYELLYDEQSTNLDSRDPAVGKLDVKVQYLHFGGTLLFPEENDWYTPYVSFTIGATRLEPQRSGYDSDTKFSLSLGGGFRLPFNENVAAVLGLRGYLTFINSNTDLFCTGSGNLNCLVRTSGSTFFQGEALLGLSMRF